MECRLLGWHRTQPRLAVDDAIDPHRSFDAHFDIVLGYL